MGESDPYGLGEDDMFAADLDNLFESYATDIANEKKKADEDLLAEVMELDALVTENRQEPEDEADKEAERDMWTRIFDFINQKPEDVPAPPGLPPPHATIPAPPPEA